MYLKNQPIGKKEDFTFEIFITVLFYVYYVYNNLSEQLNIYLPSLAGIMLLFLGLFSLFLVVTKNSKNEITLLILVIATSAIFLIVQALIHEVSITAKYNYPLLIWPIQTAIIILMTRREKFLIHFVYVTFFISIFQRISPILFGGSYIKLFSDVSAEIERINGVAALNGFCSLVFWISGWNQPNKFKRIISWTFGAISLFLMLEMTSRGALLAFVIGMIVSLRSVPKKYWLVVLFGLGVFYLIFKDFTFFSSYIESYQMRLFEETGRKDLWVGSLDLMVERPLFGYGTDLIGGLGPDSGGKAMRIFKAPHNPFLLFILGSGFIPVFPFLLIWLTAFRNSVKSNRQLIYGIDILATLCFAFIISNLSNLPFTEIWVIAVLAYAFKSGEKDQKVVSGDSLDDENIPNHSVASIKFNKYL